MQAMAFKAEQISLAAVVGILAVMTIKIKTRAQSVHPAHKVLQAHKGLLVRKALWGLQVLLDRKVPQVPKVLREIQVRTVLRDLRVLPVRSAHKVLSVLLALSVLRVQQALLVRKVRKVNRA